MKKYRVFFPNGDRTQIIYAEYMTITETTISFTDTHGLIVGCIPVNYAVFEEDIKSYQCIEGFDVDFPDGSNIEIFAGGKLTEFIEEVIPKTVLEKYFKKIR